MRCGEVLALSKKTSINPFDRSIIIDRAWKDRHEIGPPKNGKSREIPVSDYLLSYLNNLIKKAYQEHELVFCYEDGSRLGDTWWRKNFYIALEAAKLVKRVKGDDGKYQYVNRRNDVVMPHSLRHSLNTNLLAAGCNALLVEAYLGWTRPQGLSTMQTNYTGFTQEALREVAQAIAEIYPAPEMRYISEVG